MVGTQLKKALVVVGFGNLGIYTEATTVNHGRTSISVARRGFGSRHNSNSEASSRVTNSSLPDNSGKKVCGSGFRHEVQSLRFISDECN